MQGCYRTWSSLYSLTTLCVEIVFHEGTFKRFFLFEMVLRLNQLHMKE